MPVETEDNCTVYIAHDNKAPPSTSELAGMLASKDDSKKIEALEMIILHMVNGEVSCSTCVREHDIGRTSTFQSSNRK